MNKIVELVINLEEFEFEDLGVEILSLVDRPAIEIEWMAFAEDEDAKFQEALLKLASEIGEEIDPSEVIYVDSNKENFASITEILEGIKLLDILERIPADLRDQEGEIKYRYTGPSGQRTFCRTLKAFNRVYNDSEIAAMDSLNREFETNAIQ